jgi:adenine-specific DNA-methyltransferase
VWVVDLMVEKLFAAGAPTPESRILDPGCGRGAFIDGLIRWCTHRGRAVPCITGVESDPRHAAFLRERYAGIPEIEIQERDFLTPTAERYDYVIGNPPYVAITGLSEAGRAKYRNSFISGRGRFDLYLLFFEQALRLLGPNGRIVFITPEKFLYVQSADPLRALLTTACVDELHFLGEDTFENFVTYPLVTALSRTDIGRCTRVTTREGTTTYVKLPAGGESWLPSISGVARGAPSYTLSDICTRISCGVATGADAVFVTPSAKLDPGLRPFAHPTIAGRDIATHDLPLPTHVMLLPYTQEGELIPEPCLGPLGNYLAEPQRRGKLVSRTCVKYKPWYAFHETPPMRDMLRPKLLCKDIAAKPVFVADRAGTIVPRHSAYYIVPREAGQIDLLAEYLNSSDAAEWLSAHCQRAANGFIRLQSHVLKRLPVPEALAIQLGAAPFVITGLAA